MIILKITRLKQVFTLYFKEKLLWVLINISPFDLGVSIAKADMVVSPGHSI